MAVKKDEKHGTWYYYGRYTDALGNKKQYKKRGFKTKKEAKEAEQRFLLDPNSQSSMTLDNIVDLLYNHFIYLFMLFSTKTYCLLRLFSKLYFVLLCLI